MMHTERELRFPRDRYYLKNHAWLLPAGGTVTVGLTDLGQKLSKGIVHIDLPALGERIHAGETAVAYESIKAVSSVSLPFDSTVMQVNESLWDAPGRVNEDPYGEWMISVSGDFEKGMGMDSSGAKAYFTELLEQEKKRYSYDDA
ncbi:MAG TPA: glycine cleavage system protein H [Candidatus Methanoperedenaceae archaeon]|nr:glycine cleavage system protein H [Candidatus Methanoperedenaceae archaeon]